MLGNALQLAVQVTSELGLAAPTELVTSPELTNVQLLALINSSGNELTTYYDWEFLLKTQIITSVANQGAYDRPDDFGRQLNQTLWDKTNRRPAAGPLSPAGWQVLTNALISVGPFVRYRIAGRKVEFLPVPTAAGREFNHQYISNGWVNSYLDPNVYTPMVTNDLDEIQFDFWLMVKFVKLKLWQAKGLDTTSLAADFNRTFDAVTGQDHGAQELSLSNTKKTPYLSLANIPDGNWGP